VDITYEDTNIITGTGSVTTEVTTDDMAAAAVVVTTTAMGIAAEDRPGEVVTVVIWTGMTRGKISAMPKIITVGRMETGCTQVPHATILKMGTKKMPPLQICRVVCRLGAPDMDK